MVVIFSLFIFFILGVVCGYALRVKDVPISHKQISLEEKKIQEKARMSIQARTKERLDRILAYAQEHGRVTNDDVENLFCIGDRTASNYLFKLMLNGDLIRHGVTGRGVYYTLKNI